MNLFTKLEVSDSTHYEDIKGDTKCQKWGGLWWLGSLNVTGNNTNPYNVIKECTVQNLSRVCIKGIGIVYVFV